MAESLSPYLPRLAVEWDLDAPGTRWRRIDGTCCFVDISGFTALSERLARRGRIGAEELTEVLGKVFSRMLDIAYDAGGSLLKFGGDALLLAFLGDDHATRAARTAVAMRAALREARSMQTSVGRLNLRMSVGLHSGEFDFFRVGSSHREFLIAGPAATQTALMEQTADAGEIVISAATAARLPPDAVGDAKGDGRLLRWRKIVEVGVGAPRLRAVAESDIESGVPVALREHLRTGVGESEHRVATVGFVKFKGVDDFLAEHDGDALAGALDEIVTNVQAAVDAESLTFLASDIDADGGKCILVAGVPAAQLDDEGRMLRAARAILDHEYALPVRIGVNQGHVFAGEIGTEFRRTFTVMGDTVNLAARLMAAAAPGELYATGEVIERSRTLFATETLEPFHVKGKAQPVQAYAVREPQGTRTEHLSYLPFVGRDAELAALQQSWEQTRSGRGSVTVIEGDRGAGKTRLVHEFVARCDAPVLFMQGEAYATASPYLAWRAPLRALLEIEGDDAQKAALQLEHALHGLGSPAAALAPLLAPVLDVDLPPTPESAAIAPEFRQDRLGDLLVLLLERTVDPLTLIVDDEQWLDDASAALVERVVAATATLPWTILITRRPISEARAIASNRTIRLNAIDDGSARVLIDTVTASAPLRPQERDQIVARAAGNPLFIDELLRVRGTSGLDSLPETLEAVANREIDSLAPPERRLVRYASVLGRMFDAALLRALIEDSGVDPGALLGLTEYLVPIGDQLQFRHALLQEAAYASLPFRTRIELHRRAGEAILNLPARGADADDALLSLHFFRAQDWERAWKSARSAGQHAAEAYAPAEVATHLERAVYAARRLDNVAPAEIADLQMQLADAFVRLGTYDKADDAYRRAAAMLPNDVLGRGRIFERRAYVRGECQGRFTAAIRHIHAGTALLDATGPAGDEVERARVQLLAREADLRWRQGRLKDAVELCREVMVDAERIGERRALAVAMDVLDTCLVQMGRSDEATHISRVIDLYDELGDEVRLAGALGNLGGVSYFKWNWVEAADCYTRAAKAATRAGDLATAALQHANLGELLLNQGHTEEAEAILAPAVRTLAAYDDVVLGAWASSLLGRARAALGDIEGGLAIMQTAVETLDRSGNRVGSTEARARIAEVCVLTGDFEQAAQTIADARAFERTLGETPLTVLLDRIEITLAAASGKHADAIAELEDAVPRARRLRADYDLLLLLVLAGHLGDDQSRVERANLTRHLGVARFVALPDT